MRFADRLEAGRRLAEELRDYAGRGDLTVLGLPRGGVPVAAEVADALHAPLDVFVVRKLGVPGHRELALGAIASGGVRVLNQAVVEREHVSDEQIEAVAHAEQVELDRRHDAYGAAGAVADTTLLVDDGLATGATMHVAAVAARRAGARTVVCAAPVASAQAVQRLRQVADDVRTVLTPTLFGSVGNFYVDFTETTDDDVRAVLTRRSGT